MKNHPNHYRPPPAPYDGPPGLIRSHKRLKDLLRRSGLPDEALHVHLGLALYLLIAACTPGGLRSVVPLLGVAAIEVANEIVDRLRLGRWDWRDTLSDVANTLVWPGLIYAACASGLV